jgi:hypothetical protein
MREAVVVEDLLGDWRSAWTEWTAADAAGKPVNVRNRIMGRIWNLGHEIASRSELHSAVTSLCGADQDPDLRVRAALVREHWDVDGAADTHVSVIRDSGFSVARPMTMEGALSVKSSTTARTAALCLFNIDEGRGNTGAGR